MKRVDSIFNQNSAGYFVSLYDGQRIIDKMIQLFQLHMRHESHNVISLGDFLYFVETLS